jgi:hypothetical protein
MVVDPVPQEAAHLSDQLAAHSRGAAAQQPVEPALEDASRERGAGELLGIGAELEGERDDQRDGQRQAREVELQMRGEMGLQAATPSRSRGRVPLLAEGLLWQGEYRSGQADLSLLITSSLSRPVTGSLFFFW